MGVPAGHGVRGSGHKIQGSIQQGLQGSQTRKNASDSQQGNMLNSDGMGMTPARDHKHVWHPFCPIKNRLWAGNYLKHPLE